jgi:response regulator of citrate/malate metabolism
VQNGSSLIVVSTLAALDPFPPPGPIYSLLRTIREELEDVSTAIIMATALSSTEDVRDCARFAIQGYMVKPINFQSAPQHILHSYAKLYPERAGTYLELLRQADG